MLGLYQLGITLVAKLAIFFAQFNPKLQRQFDGRRGLIQTIRRHYAPIASSRERIIIHVASFGELEQAKPIIAKLKISHPKSHIHLTFFSASGYDNTIGKYDIPDLITFLPFDTKKSIKSFLDAAKPDTFIFIRYDVWPTLVDELYKRNVTMLLFCATVTNNKVQFPLIRSLYRNTYNKLSAIVTIRESDKQALLSLGIDPKLVSVAGDTRIDQVIERKQESELKAERLLSKSLTNKFILIAGSTWESDEQLLQHLIYAELAKDMLLVLAPHEINQEHIKSLHALFPNSIDYSAIESFQNESVIIVDCIGKLFSLYQYADVAYIGGGFGAGVHNTLEAAVWGAPIICGPRITRSKEISELAALGGAFVIHNEAELEQNIRALKENIVLRNQSATAARSYVEEHAGAIDRILSIILQNTFTKPHR